MQQKDWLLIDAFRENLSMVNNGSPITYKEAITFASTNFNEALDDKNLAKTYLNRNSDYKKYQEEAIGKSSLSKSNITAEMLIKKRIEEIDEICQKVIGENFGRLNRERKKLIELLDEASPKFIEVTENEALLNDYEYEQGKINQQYIRQVNGQYKVFKTSTGIPFVVRLLHPGAAEAITGVDLIYEYHQAGKVRMIAIQYKIWENNTLYYSKAKNLQAQLDVAQKCFCNGGFCENKESKGSFRLPHCIPFLRPTDKLKNDNNLVTSGWHVPICQLDDRIDYSYDDGKILRLSNIVDIAINASEFENFFSRGMIGSRWLSLTEVEQFYKEKRILQKNDNSIGNVN
jgi:hypothetical protein